MYAQRLDLKDNTEVGTCAVFDPGTMTVMKQFQPSVERRIFPAQGRLSHMAL